MSAAFTPGPWGYETDGGDWFITYAGGRVLGKVFDHVGEFQEADARLIAAAPELYASLLELLEPLERASAELVAHGKAADENAEAAFDRARSAINKARGDQ